MVAGAIRCSCGIEETSGISRVCKLLDLQNLLCPPQILQFPNLQLDSCLHFGMGCSFNLAADVILPGDKSLSLDVNKLLNFSVFLIMPVLIFPCFVTKDGFTGVYDGSRECLPVFSNHSDIGWASLH